MFFKAVASWQYVASQQNFIRLFQCFNDHLNKKRVIMLPNQPFHLLCLLFKFFMFPAFPVVSFISLKGRGENLWDASDGSHSLGGGGLGTASRRPSSHWK
jgi:hypothetical protein